METRAASEAFTALGHEGRLSVFRLLMRHAPQGVRAGEIAEVLGLKPNTASVYLKALEQAGLIGARRDGRTVYYAVDLTRTAGLVDYFLADCCRGRPDLCAPAIAAAINPRQESASVSKRVFNVLFICSGNSARSIFAEAILSELGQGKFIAYSAGTREKSELNPYAIDVLQRNGHDVSALHAKNVDVFRGPGAPTFDFVFTVCDLAAHEECGAWPGQPMTAHWGMPDPVKAEGSPSEKGLAFARAYAELNRRIAAFVALPLASLQRIALQHRLDDLGHEVQA
ncbi:metalloregulator ArsR/SmtB family transcription factor [Solirhodobacter olei]|uniref:metalloregulator ArsR/SmtB family transcription factor n=1 Tax=Solirhodobacter olei TaxID=2493082 RepID=UPI000FD6E679|nr:metalloregulator ArsR/SmtB family transcription factor [Solirhodobacter olei]